MDKNSPNEKKRQNPQTKSCTTQITKKQEHVILLELSRRTSLIQFSLQIFGTLVTARTGRQAAIVPAESGAMQLARPEDVESPSAAETLGAVMLSLLGAIGRY